MANLSKGAIAGISISVVVVVLVVRLFDILFCFL